MVRCMVSFLNPGEIGLRIGYHALYYGQLTAALLGLRVVILLSDYLEDFSSADADHMLGSDLWLQIAPNHLGRDTQIGKQYLQFCHLHANVPPLDRPVAPA